MRHRTAKSGDSIRLLKVTLTDYNGRTKGNPYRVIAMLEPESLYQLAEIIVESFNFDFDHAFGFYDDLTNPYQAKEGYELFADLHEESKYRCTRSANFARVFDDPGKNMLFLFDYGDEWRFQVELQNIQAAKRGARYPQIIESVGEAPSQYDYEDEDGEMDEGE
ncbi:MAG: hypothetical protein NTW14_12225 [bacterium]|nr:hypothetical protein [bacterium]